MVNILSTLVRTQILKLFTSRFLGRAGKMLRNKSRTLNFLSFVESKFSQVGAQGGLAAFKTVGAMLTDYSKGRYTALPWRTALSLVGGLLYLAAPIDIIPDFIPVLGLLDDVFLLTKLFSLAARDVEDYQRWKAVSVAA